MIAGYKTQGMQYNLNTLMILWCSYLVARISVLTLYLWIIWNDFARTIWAQMFVAVGNTAMKRPHKSRHSFDMHGFCSSCLVVRSRIFKRKITFFRNLHKNRILKVRWSRQSCRSRLYHISPREERCLRVQEFW